MNDYYKTCPFPKPSGTKKVKKQNGWKDKQNRYCIYCGKPYAERHELFGGANRQASIEHGLQVDLCPEHHQKLQANIDPRAKRENARLKSQAQRNYMDKLINTGIGEDKALECWMSLIGKNYLKECDPI